MSSALIPQKPSIAKKNSILGWLRNQVSNAAYQAISIILSPCCDQAITSITSTCVSAGHVTLSIKLSNNIGLRGLGTATVIIAGTAFTGTYDNAGTITVTNAAITAGSKIITASLFLPTNSAADLGVYFTTPNFTYTIPTC